MKIIDNIKEFIKKYKYIIYVIIVFIILVILIILFILNKNKDSKNYEKPEEISYVAENEIVEKEEEKFYYIDIKGEINNPGVYKLNSNSRVIDAINAAGGLKDSASTRYINLSKFITDEMVIIIYSNNEIEKFKEKEIIIIPCECEELVNDSCLKENLNENNNLININTATKEELMTLTGVGEAKANSIIEYRENKLFESLEEIKEVSGISDAIYSKIKDFITI